MKLSIKKFIYLLNDITNTLLKKERSKLEEQVRTLRFALIIVSIILLISVTFNILAFSN